jgi:hypothetical protein
MSGIKYPLIKDTRQKLFEKHLPDTPSVQRLLKKEGKAYIFNDVETMERVTRAIIERGEQTNVNDETDYYERYGLYFAKPIGYQLKNDGTKTLLYYAEIKIIKGTNIYHVIPRTKPRKSNQ